MYIFLAEMGSNLTQNLPATKLFGLSLLLKESCLVVWKSG